MLGDLCYIRGMREVVLNKFGATEGDLIGVGAQSRVYALAEGKMLRVYNPGGEDKGELLRLKVFYDGLYGKFSYKTPHILEIGQEGDVLFTVGDMIPGKALSDVLPTLGVEDKKKVLRNYFDAVEEIRSVSFPERPYGQILADDPLTAPTWTEYLQKTIREYAKKHGPDLSQDVDNFSAIVEKLCEEAATFDPNPPKYLVHGDYFANNVIVDDSLEVTGVIDFSSHTVVGDHMFDIISAKLFIESDEDKEILSPMIDERYGEVLKKAEHFYRPFFALYFGEKGGLTGEIYPKLYPWCVRTLKEYQAELV
jgi:hypothetical protein